MPTIEERVFAQAAAKDPQTILCQVVQTYKQIIATPCKAPMPDATPGNLCRKNAARKLLDLIE